MLWQEGDVDRAGALGPWACLLDNRGARGDDTRAPPIACSSIRISASTGGRAGALSGQARHQPCLRSPYLKARPGSPHGYDIVDHGALNPELGDQAAFERMKAALTTHRLRQILDFVPNHMGVGGADNPLWLDVLEWGPNPPHAGWFDIDWDPDRRDLHDKVLVPCSATNTASSCERGKLVLKFDADAGKLRGLGLRHAQAADLAAPLCAAFSAMRIRIWNASSDAFASACRHGAGRSHAAPPS